jgi:hypothetical protein
MSLNESIVEDAALEWSCLRAGTHRQVGKLGYAVGHGPYACGTLTPALSHRERGISCGTLTPALSHRERGNAVGSSFSLLAQAERDSFGEVVLVGRLREAIRRLTPRLRVSAPPREPISFMHIHHPKKTHAEARRTRRRKS